MKNKFIDLLRFVFISFETVVILAISVIYYYWPALFIKIGMTLNSDDTKIALPLVIAPIGGLIYALRQSSGTLNANNAKLLYEWERYTDILTREYFTYFLCGLSLIVNIILWAKASQIKSDLLGFLYLLLTAPWLVSVLSLALAKLRLRIILGGAR